MCTQCKRNSGFYILVGLAAIALAFCASAIYQVQQETIGIYKAKNSASSVATIPLAGTGDDYSFTFPATYTVDGPSDRFAAKTISKGMVGKLEIFKMKDFGGERPWGFAPDEDDEQISAAERQLYLDNYVPKEQLKVGPKGKEYDVWLYYNKNDTGTKNELHTILKSITF